MAGAKEQNDQPTLRVPKEHAPLDYLLSEIPKKAQKGMLIQYDLHLMSLDANENFIALGSNVGVVFLYKRKEKVLERLRTHSHNDVITSVSIHSGLEHQVAAGTEKGVVYLFQLPSVMPSQRKQLQQFIVKDIHKSEVTCICWSLNGMKLFSGDKKGLVSCTEVDFYAGVCETNICLIENCEIVQLNHAHKALLISTSLRTIIYRTDTKTALIQVGQKDRKILGHFGAVFIPGLCKPEDAELYACRPGLRIWKSKMDGTVISTYLFKELISVDNQSLELLPFNKKNKMFLPESQFGPLYLYKEKFIVTWSHSSLFILNPENTSVIGQTLHAGSIISIAVTKDEIFVLRKDTDRNVIRIAERPETLAGNTYHRLIKDKDMPDFVTTTQVKQDSASSSPSPLRFIKENVIDKIKNLDPLSEATSPVSDLVESLDKHSDRKELPPIVRLDSPDLLTVEIFSGAPPSTDQIVTSPIRRDRFNPFSKEDSNDLDHELDTSNLSLQNKCDSNINTQSPATRQTSVPTHTQSPATRQTSVPTQDMKTLTQHSGHNVITQTGGVSSATDKIKNDDIAVSVKTKKKKKKKTDNKSSPNTKISDSDTTSQNSAEVVCEQTTLVDKSVNEVSNERTAIDISDIIGLKPKEQDKSKVADSKMVVLNSDTKQDTVRSKHDKEAMETVSENKTKKITDIAVSKLEVETKSMSEGNDKTKVTLSEKNTSEVIDAVKVTMSENKNTSEICDKTKVTLSQHKNTVDDDILQTKLSVSGDILQTKVSISGKETKDSVVDSAYSVDSKIKTTENVGDAVITKLEECVQKSESVQFNVKTKPSVLFDRETKIDQSAVSDIAHTVVTHSKKNKNKSFSKLEKNLASLEEELISNVIPTYPSLKQNIDDIKETDVSTCISWTDSGNDSMHDFLLSSDKVQQEILPDSLQGASSSKSQVQSDPHGASSSISPEQSEPLNKSRSPSCDDFYSQYYTPPSALSPSSDSALSETSEHPLSDNELEQSQEVFDKKDTVKVCDTKEEQNKEKKVFNTWTETYMSGNLLSVDLSDTHVWCTDKSSNIWYSSTKTPGVKWQKASGYAKQISVSRSGSIVWRLYKDTVYAGTKITSKHPEGMKWVEAIRGVQYISVDNNSAWYIKSNGEIAMQKGLSKDRPCYKSTFIECPYKLQQILCQSNVVWGINDQCKLVYRAGIKKDKPEGKEWAEYVSPDVMMFSSVSFGDGNVAWAVDILGRIFFMTNVTMETPLGDNCWWQVPINNEVMSADPTVLDNIKSLAKIFDPQKLADLLSAQKGGLITAGIDGVWVCPEYKNTLQMCRGSIEGHYWNEVQLSGIVASIAWKLIAVSVLHLDWGLVWLQQANGELFTYSPSTKAVKTVQRPSKEHFICMSVCEEAVWGLGFDGKVYIRSGIASHCPQGAEWYNLDLDQLGDAQLIHLSCGSKNVWAVDSNGVIYQRIGVKAPTSHSLQAAWLPVDSGPSGTTFIQVHSGPSDLLVWAVDNRRQTYARIGVTDNMPIGTAWVHVPGTHVQMLNISYSYVWAVDPNGELLCRHGVTYENPAGDYWRKIPGNFVQISCSINDQLWAIGREGQIYSRKTRYLLRKESPYDGQKRKKSNISIGEDWELV